MGTRFRKSVKISKGVKVNFSKSGASLSLGGRGNSFNFGSKGVKHTFGIPGTGISHSTKIVGGKNTSHKSSSSSRSSSRSSSSSSYRGSSSNKIIYDPSLNNKFIYIPDLQIKMNSDGKVIILSDYGEPITDEAIVRKIKATDEYKTKKQNLEIQRQQLLSQKYADSIEENEKLINIHRMSTTVDALEEYDRILKTLAPPEYQIPPFATPAPTIESIRIQLTNEAQTNVTGNIFKVGKLRKQYVDDNAQSRYLAAVAAWEQSKNAYYQQQKQIEISEYARFQKVFEETKAYMEALIRGDSDVVCGAIEDWVSSCQLPLEFNVDYEWFPERNLVFLDVDLPEIEDLPDMELTRLASGNLREKKKTQATLKQEYVTLVLGLSIFISANVFNVSPAIHSIVISGYTQRRDKAGDVNDDYVYSIKFDREAFQKSVLANVVPQNFCSRFENRMNITTSMIMKKITPFDITE